MLVVVEGRGKIGFLISETTDSFDMKSSEMTQWRIDNTLVSSWLNNDMSPSIKRTFMYLPTAKDIWIALWESYVVGHDLSCLLCSAAKL